MPSLRIDLHLWAIRQTPIGEKRKPTKDGWFWRTFTDEDGHSYPALFTNQQQASHYCQLLRSQFGDDYSFSYQAVGSVNLLDKSDLTAGGFPVVPVGAPPRRPDATPVVEAGSKP